MPEITATLVKELRDKTGAGMMDCKRALSETSGDVEEAVDWLRKSGLAAAAKKAGRVASEGLVAIAVGGDSGAVVEVNAETDFVSRNESFQDFVKTAAQIALEVGGGLDDLKGAPYPGAAKSVQEKLTELIATIGENLNLRRSALLTVKSGIVASYMHNALSPGLGKIGVLVALDSAADAGKLAGLGKQLAMHVAAASPQSVSRDDLDPAIVEREKGILSEQARQSGKPEEIIEKMVEGRLRKFFQEACLVDQTYVIDGESTVSKVLEAASGEVGGAVVVNGFVRYALGEGVDKKDEDFAAEVAAVAGA